MTFLRKVAITFFGKCRGSDYKKNVANPTLVQWYTISVVGNILCICASPNDVFVLGNQYMRSWQTQTTSDYITQV